MDYQSGTLDVWVGGCTGGGFLGQWNGRQMERISEGGWMNGETDDGWMSKWGQQEFYLMGCCEH